MCVYACISVYMCVCARAHRHIVHKQNPEALQRWNVLELREVIGRDMENTSSTVIKS